MKERLYYLGFSVLPGIGPSRLKTLINYFGNAKNAWYASKDDLVKSGVGEVMAARVVEFRDNFSLGGYAKKLQDSDVKFFSLIDSGYPELLSEIKNPPIVIYVKGILDFEILKKSIPVAVVGARKITAYGRQVTEDITRDLAAAGCVVVSGLALGVDSCAHLTTIESGGKTIAVLGSGVDVCTPIENMRLYVSIINSGGAIVSECPLGQGPVKGSFPSRNRIITGLSRAVVVTEGTADSGALITAREAFKNNRKVFAVPGPITSSYSKGPNSLLGMGAIALTRGEDVLRNLEIKNLRVKNQVRPVDEEEQKIIDLLGEEQMHIDIMARRTKIIPSRLNTILSIMEIKGIIKNIGSGIFSLKESGAT